MKQSKKVKAMTLVQMKKEADKAGMTLGGYMQRQGLMPDKNSPAFKMLRSLHTPLAKRIKEVRPTMICEWCGNPFPQMRTEQILCSTKCAGHRNGNITKRKKGYLLENKLITL